LQVESLKPSTCNLPTCNPKEKTMNTETKKVCLNCERTDEVIPLLHLTFKNETKYICPQCLPTLIHKIHLLADKLPGAEMISTSH
jgi:hypothetical protein